MVRDTGYFRGFHKSSDKDAKLIWDKKDEWVKDRIVNHNTDLENAFKEYKIKFDEDIQRDKRELDKMMNEDSYGSGEED